MKFAVARNCLSMFRDKTVGPKVLFWDPFYRLLGEAVKAAAPSGQYFVDLPTHSPEDPTTPLVSAGVGFRSLHTGHYVIREHRGYTSVFLKRKYACPVTNLSAVVYTLDAYKADPHNGPSEYATFPADTTHVLVSVFVNSEGPTFTPRSLAAHFASGTVTSLEDVQRLAKWTFEYDSRFAVVAD
jgi:hypothetical protein